jgi:toxin ParE1/3/4
MRVRYSPRARDDLDQIHAYLNERSPLAATAVLKRIHSRVLQLTDSPLLGPVTEIFGVRGLSVGRYPYKAYYHVIEDEVLILHVRHLRRTPWTGEN